VPPSSQSGCELQRPLSRFCGPHPGAGMEKGRRSWAELLFCGSARAKWLQRAHFAGLRLRSRPPRGAARGARAKALAKRPEIQTSPK
jgi:hypothetical protein